MLLKFKNIIFLLLLSLTATMVPTEPEKKLSESHVIEVKQKKIRINKGSIGRHVKEIEQRMWWFKVAQYGAEGALAGACMFFLFTRAKMLLGATESVSEYKQEAVDKLADQIDNAQHIKKTNELIDVLKEHKIGHKIKSHKPWTWAGFTSNAYDFGTILLPLLGATAAQRYVQKLLVEEDIESFINNKTRILDSFEQLKVHAASIDAGASLPDFKASHAKIAFNENLRDVVAQLELIIAFMEFQLAQATKQGNLIPADLQNVPEFLHHVVDDFCDRIEHKFENVDAVVTSLTGDVMSFVDELKQIFESYKNFTSRIELAQDSLTAPLAT